MHRFVDPPMRHVIAKGDSQLAGQFQLQRLVKLRLKRRGLVLGPQHPFTQRHQTRAQGVEHGLQLGRLGARFVIIQQRVIQITAIRQRCSLFALQLQNLL